MERRKRYLKFAALVPAIVLAGGFVGVQAGVLDVLPPLPIPWLSKRAPQPDPQPQPEPTANQLPAPQEPVLVEVVPEGSPTFMGGSKTIIFAKPPGAQPAAQPASGPPPGATPPVFIGGSKSKPIITPPSANPAVPPKP